LECRGLIVQDCGKQVGDVIWTHVGFEPDQGAGEGVSIVALEGGQQVGNVVKRRDGHSVLREYAGSISICTA